jgi:hypothetical protein
MNPLVFNDLRGIDWEEQVRRAEQLCVTINKTNYFRYSLDNDSALLWSNRGFKKFRLQISHSHHDGGSLICIPFVDADYYLMERYANRLSEFIDAFKYYCEWMPTPPPVKWNAPLNTNY